MQTFKPCREFRDFRKLVKLYVRGFQTVSYPQSRLLCPGLFSRFFILPKQFQVIMQTGLKIVLSLPCNLHISLNDLHFCISSPPSLIKVIHLVLLSMDTKLHDRVQGQLNALNYLFNEYILNLLVNFSMSYHL